ncbi:MAG TPA: MFS transporter [Candidatus Lokiarchaeia archaeon]|nr:MFS transporter [Candidatus Lokiarchaeia archaeon]
MNVRREPGSTSSLLPVYMASILRNAASGLMTIALANYLLFERSFDAGMTGIITAIFSLGFVIGTLLAGRIMERFDSEKTLVVVSFVILACSLDYIVTFDATVILVVFIACRLGDGIATGVFWTVVQSYAKKLADVDQASRNRFTSMYNFSWNVGIIGGTVTGWMVTYMARTNFVGFYLNLTMAIGQALIILMLLRDHARTTHVIRPGQETSAIVRSLSDAEKRTIGTLPVGLVFLALLTHSLTTGTMSIYLPAKILALALPSYVPYMFFFEQSLMQTASMTIGGKIQEQRIFPAIMIGPLVIGCFWLLLGASNGSLNMSIAILAQAGMQGILYSAGMRFVINAAQASGKSSLFSVFQFIQGLGRMGGPLIFGFLIEAGLDYAIMAIVTFDVLVFFVLVIISWRRRSSSQASIS